jgi:hypothetical protein
VRRFGEQPAGVVHSRWALTGTMKGGESVARLRGKADMPKLVTARRLDLTRSSSGRRAA